MTLFIEKLDNIDAKNGANRTPMTLQFGHP